MPWLLAAVVILALAWALQAGLVVYAAVALGLAALAGRWFAREGLSRVSATREVSADEVEVGATVDVRLKVVNEGWRPLVWLLLEDLLPEEVLARRPPAVQLKGRRMRVRTLRGRTKTT